MSKKGIGKLLAGIIIGGAIGSVVGIATAPQEGKKTRKYLKEKASDAYQASKDALDNYKK